MKSICRHERENSDSKSETSFAYQITGSQDENYALAMQNGASLHNFYKAKYRSKLMFAWVVFVDYRFSNIQ